MRRFSILAKPKYFCDKMTVRTEDLCVGGSAPGHHCEPPLVTGRNLAGEAPRS
jgi:hypothetical protein